MHSKSSHSVVSLLLALFLGVATLQAQPDSTSTAQQHANIDDIAHKVLETTGVPSASLAIVNDGKVVYAQAYGDARLAPKLAATAQMAYSIGSISKQFTATAVLMLQQQGKLSLDDKISKWLPDLTRASDVSLRQVLSMTSGYQDYAPQDYMIPDWEKPISAQQILDRWARIPLDFEPGTKWQYSNTNYVIAGYIVEKVSGQPLFTLINAEHWYAVGDFRETELADMAIGDPATIWLLGAGNTELQGHVDSLGWGVQPDSPGAPDITSPGLPAVGRTLNWVVVAQRFPVRVLIEHPPPQFMRVGATVAILVRHAAAK